MSTTPEDKTRAAVPGSSAIDSDQLSTIREALLRRRQELVEQQESQLNALNSPDKHHLADLEEMAGDSAETDSVCTLVDLGATTLDQIDKALDKIRAGTYGVCEVCEQAIPPARLEFLPFAALCVECQRQRELEGEVTDT